MKAPYAALRHRGVPRRRSRPESGQAIGFVTALVALVCVTGTAVAPFVCMLLAVTGWPPADGLDTGTQRALSLFYGTDAAASRERGPLIAQSNTAPHRMLHVRAYALARLDPATRRWEEIEPASGGWQHWTLPPYTSVMIDRLLGLNGLERGWYFLAYEVNGRIECTDFVAPEEGLQCGNAIWDRGPAPDGMVWTPLIARGHDSAVPSAPVMPPFAPDPERSLGRAWGCTAGYRSSETPYRGGLREGVERVFAADGSVAEERSYVHGLPVEERVWAWGSEDRLVEWNVRFVDGKKEGVERAVRVDTGALWVELSWHRGKREGLWRQYWENGVVQAEMDLHEDRPIGPERGWDESGRRQPQLERLPADSP
jgi:hypothetical protein